MILSMTGYGKAEKTLRDKTIVVEIRSLNSKTMDLSMRISQQLRHRELDIRTYIAQKLERGKVDVAIYLQDAAETTKDTGYAPINWEAVRYYMQSYREAGMPLLSGEVPPDILATIMRMPDVTKPQESEDINEDDWTTVAATIDEAIVAFNAFRTQEGASLEKMFGEKLDGIATLLAEVEPYEKSRVERIKQHLVQNLEKLAEEQKQKINENRLEQEMIYYLEKLDINEEKVRLTNHIKYFRETMQAEGQGVGKKLGFIAQEMGREINTLGSKSNQSEMQIIVVKMKDILEQIKEQVLNVL